VVLVHVMHMMERRTTKGGAGLCERGEEARERRRWEGMQYI
jgi:hypothetical protein